MPQLPYPILPMPSSADPAALFAWSERLVTENTRILASIQYFLGSAPGGVLNVMDFGAQGDGATNDAPAINATFAAARALTTGAKVFFPQGTYLVTSSINAGGFGNNAITVQGVGARNGLGSKIVGAFTTANQPVVDFSGNEGGVIRDLNIAGDATTIPAHGLLIAGATAGSGDSFAGTRGGSNYLENVLVNGSFSQTAIYLYTADLVAFNRVQAGLTNAAGTGSTLYVVNAAAVTPIYTAASAFRTLSSATGLTAFHSMNGIYQPAGTTRSVWLLDGYSRIVSSVNDSWIYGGSTATAIEHINSGNALHIVGGNHESGGGSYLKTDGIKNSLLCAQVQQNGSTPLIDLKASYGSGSGIIRQSVLALGPSGATAQLINTAASDTGLLNSVVHLLDNADLVISAGQTGGNTIYAYDGTSTITLNSGTNTDRIITLAQEDVQGTLLVQQIVPAHVAPTYGTTVTINASLGATFVIAVTNTTAFTISNPTNGLTGQRVTIMVKNTIGGAGVVGAVTWSANYKLAAWTSPADTFSRSITFEYDGTNWVEITRTTADVPN